MKISIKSEKEIQLMKEAGNILALIIKELSKNIQVGIKTKELDLLSEKLTKIYGAVPAFKNYQGFPASLCVSINEEVVHGIPGDRKIKENDIVSIDFGVKYKGYYSDMAVTKLLNTKNKLLDKLVRTTRGALYKAIDLCVPGNDLIDISKNIEAYSKANGFNVVKSFVGHGIGTKLHEPPQIPNYYEGWMPTVKLKKGMVLAIEPMLNVGKSDVKVKDDKWTVVTDDAKSSAHFEHTVCVDDVPQVLTEGEMNE